MKKVIVLVLFSLVLSAPISFLAAQEAGQMGSDFDCDMMMLMMGDREYATGTGAAGMGDGMMDMGMMHGGMGDMMGNMKLHQALRMYGMLQQVRNALSITPEQLVRLQNTLLDFVRASAPIEANIKIVETELLLQLLTLLEVQGPQLDMAQVESRLRSLERLKADYHLALIRMITTMRGILTTEQLQKLHDLMLGMVKNIRNKSNQPQQQMPQQQMPQQQMPQQPGR